MNGMSTYAFEKLLAHQSAHTASQTRNAWMLTDLRSKRRNIETLSTFRLSKLHR